MYYIVRSVSTSSTRGYKARRSKCKSQGDIAKRRYKKSGAKGSFGHYCQQSVSTRSILTLALRSKAHSARLLTHIRTPWLAPCQLLSLLRKKPFLRTDSSPKHLFGLFRFLYRSFSPVLAAINLKAGSFGRCRSALPGGEGNTCIGALLAELSRVLSQPKRPSEWEAVGLKQLHHSERHFPPL